MAYLYYAYHFSIETHGTGPVYYLSSKLLVACSSLAIRTGAEEQLVA